MTKKQEKQTHDIIIIGGGPVGSLMGCLAATKGLKVAMIDQMNPQSLLENDFDGRTTSISYGSSLILKEAGAWKYLEPFTHPILTIRVSDRNTAGYLEYKHHDIGPHPLGYMVENRFLKQGLYKKSQELELLKFYAPETVKDLKWEEFKVTIELSGGAVLESPLLISAEGKFSKLRESVGISTRTWAYDQTCMVFLAQHELSNQATAYEHFHPNGPLATLPLDAHTSAIVWTDKKDLAKAFLSLSEARFNEELNRKFGSTLGKLLLKSKTWSYPLSGLLAKTLIAPRFALIGDSGHAIHPVAGQGMNLGIRDVKELTDLLLKAKNLGLDVGSYTLLTQYDKCRKLDTMSMAAMTHGLIRLFSNDHFPLQKVRSLGLQAVNNLPRLKRRITKHAMGV